jgi:twitching motility protein PilT
MRKTAPSISIEHRGAKGNQMPVKENATMSEPTDTQTAAYKGKTPLGELLLAHQQITPEQLQQALKLQTQVGGHIGSTLIEMGFIELKELLEVLSRQFGVPSANLYQMNINPDILNLIPKAKIDQLEILPIGADETGVTLAMVNPQDFDTISAIGFLLGKKIKPVVVPSFMMQAAKTWWFAQSNQGLQGEALSHSVLAKSGQLKETPSLATLLRSMVKAKASDMFITAGTPPSLKVNNTMKRMMMAPLSPEACEAYTRQLLTDEEWARFSQKNDFDLARTFPQIGRFRVSVYRQRNSVAVSLRSLPEKIPSFEALHLPPWLEAFALKPQGLILISGPAGHGKSTTLAAMVDIINNHRRCHIITLEDPVEYLHRHKLSNISQREVGRDTESFHEGLRNIFRQAPDVIVIGEMRDKQSFEIALAAAHTGHLVLTTAHAPNTTACVEGTINFFEPYQQGTVRLMLSDSLLLSLSQRLIPSKDGQGRILALEKLINSHRIRKQIRDEKTFYIRSQMQAGTEEFTSLDLAVAELCKKGLIDFEEGLKVVEDVGFFAEHTGQPLPSPAEDH